MKLDSKRIEEIIEKIKYEATIKDSLLYTVPAVVDNIINQYWKSDKQFNSFQKTDLNYEKIVILSAKIYYCFYFKTPTYNFIGKSFPVFQLSKEFAVKNGEWKLMIELLEILNIIYLKTNYSTDHHIAKSYVFLPTINLDSVVVKSFKFKKTKEGIISKKDWKINQIKITNKIQNEIQKDEILKYQLASMSCLELTEEGIAYLNSFNGNFDNCQQQLLLNIKEKNFNISRKEGERLYNCLTNLNANFRQYITIAGEECVEVDIVNSQPLFTSFVAEENLRSEKNYQLYKNEIDNYKKLAVEGNLYEYFADKAGVILTENNRKQFKADFLTVLLGSNSKFSRGKNIRKVFLDYFPNIYWSFQTQKLKEDTMKEGKRKFAKMVQKKEATTIIDNVYIKIIEKMQIPCLTIHDSIFVSKSNANDVKKIVEEEIEKLYKVKPTIKIKPCKSSASTETITLKEEKIENVEKVENNINKKHIEKYINELYLNDRDYDAFCLAQYELFNECISPTIEYKNLIIEKLGYNKINKIITYLK